MPIKTLALLYAAAAVFIGGVLAVRYIIAPAIVTSGGLAGTALALSALYLIAVALDRQ